MFSGWNPGSISDCGCLSSSFKLRTRYTRAALRSVCPPPSARLYFPARPLQRKPPVPIPHEFVPSGLHGIMPGNAKLETDRGNSRCGERLGDKQMCTKMRSQDPFTRGLGLLSALVFVCMLFSFYRLGGINAIPLPGGGYRLHHIWCKSDPFGSEESHRLPWVSGSSSGALRRCSGGRDRCCCWR